MALGFFDGLHRGHAALIRTLLYHCTQRGMSAAVFTFDRHPVSVLQPENGTPCLYSLQERLELLSETGLDEALVYPFDRQFAAWPPRLFLERILRQLLHASFLVVGPDYRFGAGGQGDIHLLKAWAKEEGIELLVADEVIMGGTKVASSTIRDLIRQGEVGQAASLLGRPYALRGIVETGRKLGQRLGFPTANIAMPQDRICPALGVYASRVTVRERTWEAITSIGLRPTVSPDETVPVIETYIYDAELPLYGELLTIDLLKFIRPEERFRSLLQLSTQIKADLEDVRLFHRQVEHCYEKLRVHDIPLFVMPSDRFARSVLHLTFRVQATAKQLACHALLMQVLSATNRRYPDRKAMALALDNLYGASLEGSVEKNGDVQTLFLSAEALNRWTDGSTPFRSVCDLAFSLLLEPDINEDGLFRSDIVEAERQNLIMALLARDNDKVRLAYDHCLQLFCPGQTHGLPANGRVEEVRDVTIEDLHKAYQEMLNNMDAAVYLGGRIDSSDVDYCQELMQRLPAVERVQLCPGRLPTPGCPADTACVTEHKAGEQSWIVLAYAGLPAYYTEQSAAMLLNNMLGGDMHSLLFDVIREQMGLAYQVFSVGRSYLSALFVLAGVAPDATDQALDAIKEQVSRLANGAFDDLLLMRSRKLLESSILSVYDDLAGMLSLQIAGRLSGRSYSLDDALLLLRSVTRRQIQQCAAAMQLRTTYILTPAPAAEQPASAGEGDDTP